MRWRDAAPDHPHVEAEGLRVLWKSWKKTIPAAAFSASKCLRERSDLHAGPPLTSISFLIPTTKKKKEFCVSLKAHFEFGIFMNLKRLHYAKFTAGVYEQWPVCPAGRSENAQEMRNSFNPLFCLLTF